MKRLFFPLLLCFMVIFQRSDSQVITFEPALSSQAAFLSQLAIESNAHWNYRNVSKKRIQQVLGVTKKAIQNDTLRLMKEEGEIIGFFGLRGTNKLNELTFLFIKKEHIGKGYGKTLFQEAIRVAQEELGWEAMFWESDPFAAEFYKKMGAKIIGSDICPLNKNYRSPCFVFTFPTGKT